MPQPAPAERQPKVNRSCLECRRRKIRCDGNTPCNNCKWYEIQAGCQYHVRKKRNISSIRASKNVDVDDIVEPDVYSSSRSKDQILQTLFPGCDLESLAGLSCSQLLQVAQNSKSKQSYGDQSQTALNRSSQYSSDTDNEREWNEPQEVQDPESAMCDDVNGLSMDIKHRSYMGISSIHAILRVIFRIRPSIQRDIKMASTNNWGSAQSPELNYGTPSSTVLQESVPTIGEKTCIDAYFAQVQGVFPILDEQHFRRKWEREDSHSRPWLALVNIVLTVGSIVAGSANDLSYHIFYMRAKSYLDLELLGTGSLESLQALCILGGCFLHYKNSPNMAHAIMGAAYRIAVALGLHREGLTVSGNDGSISGPPGPNWSPMARRRVWWSLFCLDTWGSMTLGRPTLGRWDPETMNVQDLGGYNLDLADRNFLSLQCSQRFCMIATKVQNRFAQLSPMSTVEIESFDDEVQTWYENLPPVFRESEEAVTCPETLLTARYVMRNRYWNLRLLLYRPMLLSYADRRVPFDELQPDEQNAIQKCQEIACAAIDQVSTILHALNRLRVSAAVWYLYQASMVTVLSIIKDPNHSCSWEWRASTEKALQLFECMSPWARTADRSKLVLLSIYEGCVLVPTNSGSDETLMATVAGDDFDINMSSSMWDQLGIDLFEQDWPWDGPKWTDDTTEYTPWDGS